MYLIAFLIIILLEIANILINKRIYSSMNDSQEIPLMKGLPQGLPVMTLKNNNQWFYFIVDTGSNISMLSEIFYNKIKVEKEACDPNLMTTGIGGTVTYTRECIAKFEDIKGTCYNINFSISPQLNGVASAIKDAVNIEIAGLIGTDFLYTNGYIVDFNSLSLKRKIK